MATLSAASAAYADHKGDARAIHDEYKRLRAWLREYEHQFEVRHGRRPRKKREWEPVLEQYERYEALREAQRMAIARMDRESACVCSPPGDGAHGRGQCASSAGALPSYAAQYAAQRTAQHAASQGAAPYAAQHGGSPYAESSLGSSPGAWSSSYAPSSPSGSLPHSCPQSLASSCDRSCALSASWDLSSALSMVASPGRARVQPMMGGQPALQGAGSGGSGCVVEARSPRPILSEDADRSAEQVLRM